MESRKKTQLEKIINCSNNKLNLCELNKIADACYSLEFIENSFLPLARSLDNRNTFFTFISKNKEDFDESRCKQFLDFKSKNTRDTSSKIYFQLLYGEKVGLELYNKRALSLKDKFSKFYTVEYYMSQGYDEAGAKIKIDDFKSKKATSRKNFIEKYGKTEGEKKYLEYVEKSKNTIVNFKKRYGDNWKIHWDKYTSKDSSSMEWAIKKANGDSERAVQIFDEKNKKTTVSYSYLVEKYGEEAGLEKYREINQKKDASSLDYFLRLCNNNTTVAMELYSSQNLRKDSSSLSYFLKKYSDNLELGLLEYNKKRQKSDCASIYFFLKKANGDLVEAKKMYYEAIKKRKVKSLKASKASLIYFRPIYDFLLNQYADNEIFLGIEDSKEFFIYNENTYDLFFYDFAIPKEKIIIEFNGKAWHPNWEKYDTNTLEENFKFNTIKDISYYVNRDKHKIDVARQKGFDVLILWEEDSVEENWNKVKRFLNDKKINYEN